MDIDEIIKKSKAMDTMLSMITEFEGCPLEFKIIAEDKKAREIYTELMTNNDFIRLSDDDSLKRSVYNFMVQATKFFTEVRDELNKK